MTQVTAQIILRLPSGASALDAGPPGAGDLERPSQQTYLEAKQKLQALGFDVGESGATGWTVSADQKTFESVFHITLEQHIKPDGSVSGWSAKEPIQVNEEFKSWLADVVFSIQPIFVP